MTNYLNQTISTFIDSQFPAFYQDEGPNFIAFTKAYYEWLEVTNRYTLSHRPDASVNFEVGKQIIICANTAQAALIVGSGDNTIDVVGEIPSVVAGETVYQINILDSSIEGTLTVSEGSRVVIGDGTNFLTDFAVGEGVGIGTRIYLVEKLRSDTELVLTEVVTYDDSDLLYTRYVLSDPVELTAVYQTPSLLAASRRIPDDADIDTALPQFVQYFKTKYLNPLPSGTAVSQRFLVKHIQDLYRAKGSQRAYELLFRILFNEDVEVFLPSQHLFAPSEADWYVPRYIEVSDSPNLNLFINTRIYSSSRGASATVENIFKKNVGGKIVCGMVLSSIVGTFHYGEQILSEEVDEITTENAPFIFGSLSSISLTNGGTGFAIGDILDIAGAGVGGKALITSVTDETGKVNFTLENGGFGYTMNASIIVDSSNTGGTGATFSIGGITNKEIISVSTDVISDYINTQLDNTGNTFTVVLTGVTGIFSVGEYVMSSANVIPLDVTIISGELDAGESISNGAITALVGRTDSSYLEITGNTAPITTGMILVGSSSLAEVEVNGIFPTRVVECNGYVTAVVGSNLTLSNCYFYSAGYKGVIDTSISVAGSGYANGEIVSFSGGGGSSAEGIIETSNTGNVTFCHMRSYGNSYTSAPTPSVATTGGAGVTITPVVDQIGGYPYPNAVLTGQTSAAFGTVSSVVRLTNWGFPAVSIPDVENLDSIIGDTFTTETLEIGTIRYITGINPGDGYASIPSVTIIEPTIALLAISDGFGGTKGTDAVVSATAGFAEGVATSIRIIDSGYGYIPQESLVMTSPDSNQGVAGDSIIDQGGISLGYWRDRKSFPSENMYIQDSRYWQRFSYDLQAPRMIGTYRSFVKEIIHPAGLAMFGTFKKSVTANSESIIAETSLAQS